MVVDNLAAYPLGESTSVLVLLSLASSLVPFIHQNECAPVVAMADAPPQCLIYCSDETMLDFSDLCTYISNCLAKGNSSVSFSFQFLNVVRLFCLYLLNTSANLKFFIVTFFPQKHQGILISYLSCQQQYFTYLYAWISYHSLPGRRPRDRKCASLYLRFRFTWMSLKFGYGMPTCRAQPESGQARNMLN